MGLAVAIMAGGADATPVLTDGQAVPAVPKVDDRRADSLPGGGAGAGILEFKSPASTWGFGELPVYQIPPARMSGPEQAPAKLRNAAPRSAAHDGDIHKPSLPETGDVNAFSAGTPVDARERPRREGTQEVRPGGSGVAGTAEPTVRDAIVGALDNDGINFTLPGLGDVNLTLSADRRSVLVNGSRMSSLVPYDTGIESALQRAETRSAATGTAFAGSSQFPEGDRWAGDPGSLMDLVSRFLTDPVTITVASCWLIAWLGFEYLQFWHLRRQQRRQRHGGVYGGAKRRSRLKNLAPPPSGRRRHRRSDARRKGAARDRF